MKAGIMLAIIIINRIFLTFLVKIPTKRNQAIPSTFCGMMPFKIVSKELKPKLTNIKFPNDVVPPLGRELMSTRKKKI